MISIVLGADLPRKVTLEKNTEVFRLITRLQDEAHRFALSYHNNLRGRTSLFSILDEIPNIGPARKKALLGHFGGMDAIKKASLEELNSVKGMNEKASQSVYDFFHRSVD